MAISAPSPRRWPRRSTRCARRPRSSRAFGRRRPIASRVSTSWPSSGPNVIARRDTLRREGADLSAGEDHIRDLERRFATARGAYAEAAAALSSARGGAADRFARELEQRLAELAMDQTRVEVRFQAPLPPE